MIAQNGALDFDALQLRLHPAASRVKLLSEQIPSSVVFFDLLAHGARDVRNVPFAERRTDAIAAREGEAADPSDAGDH